MILVTGASGMIGSDVVRRLAQQGEPVRAMTRNPARVGQQPGVEVVFGDFDKPASLAEAAAGASTLFLLSAPGPALVAQDTSMLDAARSAGVTKVVKLSAIGTGERDNAKIGAWHRPGEEAARASGVTWTILRPSSFASNTLGWASQIRAGDPIPNMSGAGTQGVIDPRDIAAVAARVLTSSGHGGQTYTLTGPELLSVPDQAAQLGDVLGRTVNTIDISLDVAREQMLAAGVGSAFVDVVVDGAEFVRNGGNTILTDDVERVLGRAPRSFRAWAQDHRPAFG